MKILVIGNGFDLAHYLPTSYNHFMGVMAAIEKLPEGKNEIGFDDLFGELAINEQRFFDRAKNLYSLENICYDVIKVYSLKYALKENSWYSYFKNHLAEIETWIDFETKVEEALNLFSIFWENFDQMFDRDNDKEIIFTVEDGNSVSVRFNDGFYKKISDVFTILRLLDTKIFHFVSGLYQERDGVSEKGDGDFAEYYISEKFLSFSKDHFIGLKSKEYLDLLLVELISFIDIFDSYFNFIISRFSPKKSLSTISDVFEDLSFLYSFNYTSTFSRLYSANSGTVQLDYIHGQSGNSNKRLVLGISELPTKKLKELKAFGFVKYHQKLLNNTDYKFLRENRSLISLVQRKQSVIGGGKDKVEIYIWGHSLDVSDQEYIKEIFSFNVDTDNGVRVVVFYHSPSSKFSMLSNLLHILGKKLVEYWMKKDFLKFKQAPDIYELNCQPV